MHLRLAAQTAIRHRLIAAALWLATILSSCHQGDPKALRLHLRVSPQHPSLGPADIEVSVFDRANRPVPDAAVSIEADMSHPGMKPVFATAVGVGANRYRAKIRFDMPGDWIISFRANSPEGALAEEHKRLTVREK